LTQKLRTSVSASDRYVVRDWKAGDISLDKARDDVATQHAFSAPSALAMSANGDFAGVRRLLDVAGGSGVFALALAQKHPEIHCTVAELPAICRVTDEYIAAHGLVGRVDTRHLNMFFEDWPTDYDAILLSSVLHDWGAEHRGDLMRRAFAALPHGGRLYIHEMLLSDARDGPLGPALFSVNMRVTTLGKQFTVPELRTALEEAGFANVTVQNTYGYFSLACARKP
jgi:cyclopropane fatty-acyl-phospholipid synthase-like methyltransferase